MHKILTVRPLAQLRRAVGGYEYLALGEVVHRVVVS